MLRLLVVTAGCLFSCSHAAESRSHVASVAAPRRLTVLPREKGAQWHTAALDIRGGASSTNSVDAFLHAVDLFGTGVFAYTGALTAGKKGMDLMGMLIVATITAVGGGTVRDTLMGSGTVFWMREAIYLQICGATVLATFLLWPTLETKFGFQGSAVPICYADALGLAAFSVLGTQKAVSLGLHPLMWIVSGLLTACFGGMIRDVLCLQRPRILYPDRTPYAPAPLLGSAVYAILTSHCQKMDTQTVACVSFLVTFFTRVLSFKSPMRLPHWKDPIDNSL